MPDAGEQNVPPRRSSRITSSCADGRWASGSTPDVAGWASSASTPAAARSRPRPGCEPWHVLYGQRRPSGAQRTAGSRGRPAPATAWPSRVPAGPVRVLTPDVSRIVPIPCRMCAGGPRPTGSPATCFNRRFHSSVIESERHPLPRCRGVRGLEPGPRADRARPGRLALVELPGDGGSRAAAASSISSGSSSTLRPRSARRAAPLPHFAAARARSTCSSPLAAKADLGQTPDTS